MISLLKTRGLHIKNNDWKNLKQVNEDLDRLKTKEF